VVTIARRRRDELGPQGSPHFADRLAMIETLAAGVAHGINNPLSYVKANVTFTVAAIDTLLEENWNDGTTRCLNEIRHVLQHAEEGANRIGSIVSDLLVFSRHHNHRGPSVGVDLHELLDAIVRLNTHAFRGRVRLDAHLGPVPRVDGEPAALAQVFANIVQNAVLSRPDICGEAHIVTICTSTDPESGWAVVAIRDQGEGMDSDVLRHVFEPFFTTRAVGEGSGLGLPVAMGIVRSAGGHIDIESERGRGTCVRVALPPRDRAIDSSCPRNPQET
jgi:signal transduction histidine kinase